MWHADVGGGVGHAQPFFTHMYACVNAHHIGR